MMGEQIEAKSSWFDAVKQFYMLLRSDRTLQDMTIACACFKLGSMIVMCAQHVAETEFAVELSNDATVGELARQIRKSRKKVS